MRVFVVERGGGGSCERRITGGAESCREEERFREVVKREEEGRKRWRD